MGQHRSQLAACQKQFRQANVKAMTGLESASTRELLGQAGPGVRRRQQGGADKEALAAEHSQVTSNLLAIRQGLHIGTQLILIIISFTRFLPLTFPQPAVGRDGGAKQADGGVTGELQQDGGGAAGGAQDDGRSNWAVAQAYYQVRSEGVH